MAKEIINKETSPNQEVNNLLDKLGGWLIFCLCLIMIGGAVLYFVLRPSAPAPYQITMTVAPDSTGVVSLDVMQKIDALAELVKQQNTDVQERYAYMIEQKEHENTIIAIGSILVSIILAIFGFFGYRSFKSIEDKAVNNAREKASSRVNTEMVTIRKELDRELRGVIDKTFLDEYENRLKQKVSGVLNEVYNETISARLASIQSSSEELEDIKNRLTSAENFISALRDNGITVRINAITGDESDVSQFAEDRKRSRQGETPEAEEGGDQ